ncbi:hypothetical protein P154DRAFT_623139 [Amniculicola lignicola CBS 123094]|uniref:Uncharacterized protein n=1 Tax=Amniculicola lignicola CBS 123094 TaxID=1392246 RepID=A0A6A5W5F8_9PLEO|nr:hypothetical protein P154DRAFT_623139 [Amniculicola lignicola CBS 123094]
MSPPTPPPVIQTSFLSVRPHEPVLVFASPEEAARFQTFHCRQARTMHGQDKKWLFLPLPDGLLRVRTARHGDISYEFTSHQHAKDFNACINWQGRVYEGSYKDSRVYVGREIK